VGPILDRIIEATELIDVEVLYLNAIPNNKLNLARDFCKKGNLIIVEPFYSGPVLQKLSETLTGSKHRILQIGIPRKFLQNYGTAKEHYTSIGFDPAELHKQIVDFIDE
jgi:hypothetical protein